MFFYINNNCNCVSKKDKDFFKGAIQKYIHNKNNIFVTNEYVRFYLNNNEVFFSFSLNTVLIDEEKTLANWLLYVYDMCHENISKLLDPNNVNRRKILHMNAVKNIMYSVINKLIWQDEFDVPNIIWHSIIKINKNNPYDFYSLEANYLFFIFLLKWFNLNTNDKNINIFNKITSNNFLFIDFKNSLFYQPLIKYKNIDSNDIQISKKEFNFQDKFTIYKTIHLKSWFDNSKITLIIDNIINSTNFLESIERLIKKQCEI